MHRIPNSLHLIVDDGRASNSALSLFAKDPQKWFVSSTEKCVRFSGTKVQKLLASQQIYGGSVFEFVDHAEAFVIVRCVESVLRRPVLRRDEGFMG